MNIAAWLLIVLIAGLMNFGGGYWLGHADGKSANQATQDRQTVKDMGEIINSHTTLIKDANAASTAMRKATAQRVLADHKSTEEFNHALAKTSGSRAGCVFDDGVMRQLDAARERAAQAAADGLRGAVPTAGGAAGP